MKMGNLIRTAVVALLLPVMAVASADNEVQALLQRTADYISSLGRYEARFDITAGDYFSSGSYVVDGDAYYIRVEGAEVYSDGKTRYEVDNSRREVNVDDVDIASRNVLDNPTRCFDFVGSDYEAEISTSTATETTLRLRSRDKAVEGEIYLTVDTATGCPKRVVYVLYEDRVEVEVTHLESSRKSVRRYAAKEYDGYETIDFR